jgi:hypothetical protein
MKSSPRYLIIPDTGREEIHQLLMLSAEQLQIIAQTLRSKETLKIKESSYRRVASAVNITNEQALAILSAMTNLLLQRQRYALSDEQLLDELRDLWPEEIAKLTPLKRHALIDFLSESDEGYFVEKAESLKTGFSPHIVSVRSICDVRPVFDKDRKTIAGVLLVASVGITTHDENHEDKTLVLQMTKSDIQKLRECLEETERKMLIMQQEFGENFDILS